MTASTSEKSSQWPGIMMVIVGAFCFSLAIPFTRWTEGLNTSTIAFFRALFGFMFLFSLTSRFREPVQVRSYRAVIPRLLLLSTGVIITVVSYTYSVQHTTAANAVLLVNTAPVYVAVLAPVLIGEKRARNTWISLALALTGMILITDPRQLDLKSSEMGGIIAGAISGVGYGSVMLISRTLGGRVSGLTQNIWSNGLIVVVLLPWAVQTPASDIVSNLPVLIPLGIFSLGMSYWLYFMGLARVSAQVVSIASLFEPVFGIMMGIIFFAEVPNELVWAGGALILGSILLISRD